MQKKVVLFHQDNTPCHKSIKTMIKLNELSFKLPDRFPGDYWIFADLQKILQQRQIILQKRHRKVRKALKWMYYAWKKLCWWIKSNFSNKLFFSQLDPKFIEWCVKIFSNDYKFNRKACIIFVEMVRLFFQHSPH